MVDDAHSEGVIGRGGRGIVDHFGLHGTSGRGRAPFPKPSAVWVDWLPERPDYDWLRHAVVLSCSIR